MRKIILTAAVFAALALTAACSMEPGGSEDPAGFTKVQGLEQPAAQDAAAAPAGAADALQTRIADLETENARLQSRLDELERRMTERADAVDQRLSALESRPEAPSSSAPSSAPNSMESGDSKPLIDLGDDKAFEDTVVRQGLEQILNMSRLLLDKMEYEMKEKLKGDAASGQGGSAGNASSQPAAVQ